MRTCHTNFKRGKRVRVKLRNGEVFVDKFIKNDNGRIFIGDRVLRGREVSSITYYREQPHGCIG